MPRARDEAVLPPFISIARSHGRPIVSCMYTNRLSTMSPLLRSVRFEGFLLIFYSCSTSWAFPPQNMFQF